MRHVLFQGAEEIFAHGEALLDGLADADYCRRLEGAYGASIGAHYRHCLEHFGSLFAGIPGGVVNYDARSRCPHMESNREQALARTWELHGMLRGLDDSEWGRVVQVQISLSSAETASAKVMSTVARELVFCLGHTIHHYALIGVIAGQFGIEVPAGFGVAPSTQRYLLDSGNPKSDGASVSSPDTP
jgi:hypothetical protein